MNLVSHNFNDQDNVIEFSSCREEWSHINIENETMIDDYCDQFDDFDDQFDDQFDEFDDQFDEFDEFDEFDDQYYEEYFENNINSYDEESMYDDWLKYLNSPVVVAGDILYILGINRWIIEDIMYYLN